MEYQIIPMTPAQLPQAAALERACFSHPWTEAVRTKPTPSAGELWKTPMTSGVHAHRS